jgi:hypothetical protein
VKFETRLILTWNEAEWCAFLSTVMKHRLPHNGKLVYVFITQLVNLSRLPRWRLCPSRIVPLKIVRKAANHGLLTLFKPRNKSIINPTTWLHGERENDLPPNARDCQLINIKCLFPPHKTTLSPFQSNNFQLINLKQPFSPQKRSLLRFYSNSF